MQKNQLLIFLIICRHLNIGEAALIESNETVSCRQTKCENGGSFDLNTCVCRCVVNFIGSDCSIG